MTRRRVLIAAGVWGALSLELLRSGAAPSIPLLAAIVALGAAFLFVGIDLVKASTPIRWPGTDVRAPVDSRLLQRADKLRAHATGAANRTTTTLHETLVELVDERLMSQHGIDRQADPVAANRTLPASLQQLVSAPSRRIADANTLSDIVADIEEL